MNKKIMVMALVALIPAGCAGGFAGDRYTPVIDQYGSPGKNPAAYPGDLNQCQVLAAQRPQARDAIKGAGVGAVIGAAGGALGGVLAGSPGRGAALGAGLGTLVGGAGSGIQGNVTRQDIVIQCMRNKGWLVLAR